MAAGIQVVIDAALADRGAVEIGRFDELGSRWITMRDPEGDEFCVH